MRRRRKIETRTNSDHDDVIAWYREKLAEPARFPWTDSPWPPELIGPTWQTTPDGHWLLPEATTGWDALGWTGTELQHNAGVPWQYTLEQARFILWWNAVDEHGKWISRDGVLQRLKGWGKDPVGATLLYLEAIGPCRVAYMENDQPVATDCEAAWVQTAATSKEQTRNTMSLMPALATEEAKKYYRIKPALTLIHLMDGTRLIQAITSSPATLEGARGTFLLKNEPHHWVEANGGLLMAEVIDRNAAKSAGGAARTLSITNAPDPNVDSVALRDRDAYELAAAGESYTTGILYDSVEAHPEAPLTPEAAPAIVTAIRGDSVWLDPERIVKSILDTRNPASQSRRFWYNQLTASEDAWLDPQHLGACRADLGRCHGERLALFFDGSKSDDATALMGCRLSDGHLLTLGMWQKPPKGRGVTGWTAPRDRVDTRVVDVHEQYRIVAFWADPSHTRDDETQERYWDDLIDTWHRRWHTKYELWAQPSQHSVMWDMTSSVRTEQFTAAAERFVTDIDAGAELATAGEHDQRPLTHDGDGRFLIHCRNARRYPNRYGVSLWKGHRESEKKIDLAVCGVGARMLRRELLNQATKAPRGRRGGTQW